LALADLLTEARNMLQNIASRIDDRVLAKTEELKAEEISLVSLIKDVIVRLTTALNTLLEKVEGHGKDEGVISLERHLYVVYSKDMVAVVKTKPVYTVLSYNRQEKALRVKSRRLTLELTASKLTCSYVAVKAGISIDNPDDYRKHYTELSYVVKKLNMILENYTSALAEAGVKST